MLKQLVHTLPVHRFKLRELTLNRVKVLIQLCTSVQISTSSL